MALPERHPSSLKYGSDVIQNIVSGDNYVWDIVLDGNFSQTITHDFNSKNVFVYARATVDGEEKGISPDFGPDPLDPYNKVIVKFDKSYVGKIILIAGGPGFNIANVDFQPVENIIINPEFEIAQRAATSGGELVITAATLFPNNDGAYFFDRYITLSDGNDIVDWYRTEDYSGFTGLAGVGRWSLKGDVQTSNKQWGFVQHIESCNFEGLFGRNSSLSFAAVSGGTGRVKNLRVGILRWDGTKDAPNFDPVSAWNGAGVNPTLKTNWSFINTPVNIPLVDGVPARIKLENIGIPKCNNISVMIWVDDADGIASSTKLYITQLFLHRGERALEFHRRGKSDEIARCQRYVEKSYNLDVVPGTITNNGVIEIYAAGVSNGTSPLGWPVKFETRKRTSPILYAYSPTVGSGGTIASTNGRVDNITTAVEAAANGNSEAGFSLRALVSAGSILYGSGHFFADSELGV